MVRIKQKKVLFNLLCVCDSLTRVQTSFTVDRALNTCIKTQSDQSSCDFAVVSTKVTHAVKLVKTQTDRQTDKQKPRRSTTWVWTKACTDD